MHYQYNTTTLYVVCLEGFIPLNKNNTTLCTVKQRRPVHMQTKIITNAKHWVPLCGVLTYQKNIFNIDKFDGLK